MRAKKHFGQHFLHDPSVIDKILLALSPRQGEAVVEIGPGRGALTRSLLAAVGELDVVEIDPDVLPELESRCAGLGTLRIHRLDVLRFDFAELARQRGTLRIVGNLPYNISTPLLFHILDQRGCMRDAHFMLQKEVAERLAAEPGGGDYGRLSVMVQYHCAVTSLFNVKPGAFSPPPRVDSSVVRLVPYASPPHRADDENWFGLVVNTAFQQRRKTLRNAVKRLMDAETIEKAGLDPNQRPETLSVANFVALANCAKRIEDN